MLASIVTIARERDVDLVVVAGDQFDGPNPNPTSERLVIDALCDLADVAPVVVRVCPSKTQTAAVVIVITRPIDSDRSCQRRHEFVVLPRERSSTQSLGRRAPRGEGRH